MKKIVKVVLISLLSLFLLLLALPFAFKNKLLELVKTEANKNMNARLEFGSVNLSFIRNFPNITLGMGDLCISGIDEFAGDTLIRAKEISVTVSLNSLFSKSGYEISKIAMDRGVIHAIINVKGKANWDIMKADSAVPEQSESSDFKLSLKKVIAKHSDLYYDDKTTNLNLAMKAINLTLSGDMTADRTTIATILESESLSLVMDKIPYLNNVKAGGDILLDADFKNMKFTFSKNQFRLNEIQASLDGWIALSENDGMNMDLKLNAPETKFKDILSMIPAIYARDFKDIKTSGEATLDASAKGILRGDVVPAFNLKMTVVNAMFQYPSLPKSINKIQLNAAVSNPGGSMDKTLIDVPKFHFELSGTPFDMTLRLSTPMSDPNFSLSAVGQLDMGMIKEVYPLQDMELSGRMNANLKVTSRMSAIENEQYENVNASGTLNIKDMIVKGKDKKEILINDVALSFSPRYVDLTNLAVQVGKNDISATGKLENLIPYILKDEILKGTLIVQSNYLNLNDFMSESEVKSTTADTAQRSGAIEIPRNIDFNLSGKLNKLIVDKFEMEQVTGQVTVQGGKAEMKNVNMNALGGNVGLSGFYDTSKNPKQPDASFSLDVKNASFVKTFTSFVTVQKIAPIFESLMGNYSTSFQMSTPLGMDLMPILTSLNASGLLQSSDVGVKNTEILNVLASSLKNESLKNLKVKDLRLPFSINAGRVTTKPFDVNFGSGKMNLSGSTGLDQSIDYVAKVDLPNQITKGYANSVKLKIGGTFTNPKINLDVADLTNQALNKVAGSVLGGDNSTTLNEKVNAEISKQTETIRKQAQDAGELLIVEAEKQGQSLINEANKTKNPLVKMATVKAAESAAIKLKSEAKKKADQLNAESEKQIQSLEQKTKNQLPQ